VLSSAHFQGISSAISSPTVTGFTGCMWSRIGAAGAVGGVAAAGGGVVGVAGVVGVEIGGGVGVDGPLICGVGVAVGGVGVDDPWICGVGDGDTA